MSETLLPLPVMLPETPVAGQGTAIQGASAQPVIAQFREILAEQFTNGEIAIVTVSEQFPPLLEDPGWRETAAGGNFPPPEIVQAAIAPVAGAALISLGPVVGSGARDLPVADLSLQAPVPGQSRNETSEGRTRSMPGEFPPVTVISEPAQQYITVISEPAQQYITVISEPSRQNAMVELANGAQAYTWRDEGGEMRADISTRASPEQMVPGVNTLRADSAEVDTLRLAGMKPEQTRIPGEVSSPRWGDAVNNRIAWMVGKNIQTADLRLNPPELGPLSVRIALNREDASVQFTVQNPIVREALETAMPRLRDMLQENGLNLVQADVSGGGGDNSRDESATAMEGKTFNEGEAPDLEQDLENESGLTVYSTGLIDAYV